MGENVATFLLLDPSFVRFSKKCKKSFPIWVKFKVILMVFAIFCHQLYDDHVKGSLMLFAMNIKVMASLWGKTSQKYFYWTYFDWTPVFAVLTKSKESFFRFSVKFKVVLMVFVAVYHTFYNDHVKGNFILFAMIIKVMAISWGKTSQCSYF